MSTCIKCGAALQEQTGRGRPALYCGRACRRAAELEIRRINNRLSGLEDQLMRARLPGCLVLTPIADIEAELGRQETRLRQLLAAGEGNCTAGETALSNVRLREMDKPSQIAIDPATIYLKYRTSLSHGFDGNDRHEIAAA